MTPAPVLVGRRRGRGGWWWWWWSGRGGRWGRRGGVSGGWEKENGWTRAVCDSVSR